MPDTNDRNDVPTTEDEFRAALERLVLTAVRNDVQIEGGWDVPVGLAESRWGIEIYRVVRG